MFHLAVLEVSCLGLQSTYRLRALSMTTTIGHPTPPSLALQSQTPRYPPNMQVPDSGEQRLRRLRKAQRIRHRRLPIELRATRRVIKTKNKLRVKRAIISVGSARALVQELKVDAVAASIIETAKQAREHAKSHLEKVKDEAEKKLWENKY